MATNPRSHASPTSANREAASALRSNKFLRILPWPPVGDALVGASVAWLFLTVVLAPHAGRPVLLLLLFATGAGSFNLVLSLLRAEEHWGQARAAGSADHAEGEGRSSVPVAEPASVLACLLLLGFGSWGGAVAMYAGWWSP